MKIRTVTADLFRVRLDGQTNVRNLTVITRNFATAPRNVGREYTYT